MAEDLTIELPIETERLVIRPLELAHAADLREDEEWIPASSISAASSRTTSKVMAMGRNSNA